jgi:chitin synthase
MKRYLDETNSFETMNDEFTESEVTTNMNLFMCVKYKNSGKLSSHNWFFNGFCKELKPKYAILLDVGLRPEGKALFKMYKHMIKNKNVGGVCGYMSLKI